MLLKVFITQFGCLVLQDEQTKKEVFLCSPGFSVLADLLLSKTIRRALFANSY